MCDCVEFDSSKAIKVRYMTAANMIFLILLLSNVYNVSSHEVALYSSSSNIHVPVSSIACSNSSTSSDVWGTCPPWSTCDPEQHTCRCHDELGKIICGLSTTRVAKCHCLTYNSETVQFVFGPCFYDCGGLSKSLPDSFYYSIPNNLSSINSAMCGRLNRAGTLCGECLSGHRPLAYTYYMNCVECPHSNKNWWKFILAAFLPLTVFYFIVFLFRVRITPPYLYSFIFYSQCVTSPAFLRTAFITTDASDNVVILNLLKVLSCLYSIWSLDFFRGFYDGFCLGLDTLQNLALEYVIAFYPMVLMLLTFLIRKLNEKECLGAVFLMKHVNYVWSCFTLRTKKSEDTRSLIDAYVVFFVLSLTKIIYVSFDLLTFVPVDVLSADGKHDLIYVLYYDGSKPYFGSSHLPYAILALFVMTICVALPLLILLLYPCKFFRIFLSKLPQSVNISLHYFIDKFQGYYKNGLNGTRDYRYFSVSHILLMILLYVVYACTLTRDYYSVASGLLMLAGVVYLFVQPYKTAFSHYSKVTSVFFVLLGLQYSFLAVALSFNLNNSSVRKSLFVCAFLLSLFPALYISCIFTYWMAMQYNCGRKCMARFITWGNSNEERIPICHPVTVN